MLRKLFTCVIVSFCLALTWSTVAFGQLPVPTSSQFDVTGFLQEATVRDVASPTSGGTLKVNGLTIVVPDNLIVILPANALTWQELFTNAPAPYTGTATGMAMNDLPAPLTTYEVHVVGNRVVAPGVDEYRAALIDISQQALNSGQGYINFIDYGIGEMRVGGTVGDPNCIAAPTNTMAGGLSCSGTRVRINDPAKVPLAGFTAAACATNPLACTGRFSKGLTPDARFTVDQDNPTIRSETAYPMCLPRTDPAIAIDPICPQTNRPFDTAGHFVTIFTMQDPKLNPAIMDPRQQAPFEVGDFITFAGTLVTDDPAQPTAGPLGSNTTYISAHTIIANVAIYTAPGTDPAYVAIDVTILGTGGTTAVGLTEAAARTRFEGFSTDASRHVHLFGIDVIPGGATSDRDWGSIDVDPGAPTGAVQGRWRFRPPSKVLSMPPATVFLPATREVRAAISTGEPGAFVLAPQLVVANGLISGQYHAPILEYIFPENIPGAPIPPNNFETMPFLAQGGYTSSQGTVAGPLNPWPGDPATAPPPPGPTGPSVTAFTSNASISSGGTITLSASATGTAPITFSWAQTSPASPVAAIATPTSTANVSPAAASTSVKMPVVGVDTTFTFTVTASNTGGSSTFSVTVRVLAAPAPTANAGPPQTVPNGSTVTLLGSGTDPNGLSLTYQWIQGGPTLATFPVAFNPSANVAQPTFTLMLPIGQPAVTLNFELIVTNSNGVSSLPSLTTVTVNPTADQVAITAAEYRTGKQRLTVNATSSVISPNVQLTLQPYLTSTGAIFDPSSLGAVFTPQGGGLYILTLVGAPEPAVPPATPLTVKSNLGGVSPASGLTRIRN